MELTKQATDKLQAEVNQAIDTLTEKLVFCHFHVSGNSRFQIIE